jgi:citrate synthase
MSGGLDSRYLTASEAAEALGVSRQTLYVYVGRKGIRSQPVEGTRQRKYWRADIERVRNGDRAQATHLPGELKQETAITLITEQDLYYRGRSVLSLAETSSFESVAALLWGVDEGEVFTHRAPEKPATFASLDKLLDGQDDINRATAMFPTLEDANPRAFDLTRAGMARTGADVLRWLAALTVRSQDPPTEPIHLYLADKLGRDAGDADLIRRVLVLSADHGFEPGTVAVRGVASTGVTPWRSVMTGLSISGGRRGRMGSFDAIGRFLREIAASPDPIAPVVQRIKDGEDLPGFDSMIYTHGDPRGRALLSACARILGDDEDLRRLQKALDVARDIKDLEPNFALPCLFVMQRIGAGPRSALFYLGRAAGWIAHAIEQHEEGELPHRPEVYTGPLPT